MERESYSAHAICGYLEPKESRPSERVALGLVLLLSEVICISGITACGKSGGYPDSGYPNCGIFDTRLSANFHATGHMADSRSGHTATLLPDGKVLVTGGGLEGLPSAELYDPATCSFTVTGHMADSRSGHTATLLSNGKVLVTGGRYLGDVASAELYDPATGSFSPTGSMTTPRKEDTATLLPNGKVLVTGGHGWSFPLSGRFTAELYDPATSSFTATGIMATVRSAHTATLLSNGKVLVTGGYYTGGVASAELYDPAVGSFRPTGSMATERGRHTATLLPNGKVLVTGGIGGGFGGLPAQWLRSAELYDPATGSFSPTGTMATERGAHTATLVSNGKVLVAGGVNRSTSIASAELYEP